MSTGPGRKGTLARPRPLSLGPAIEDGLEGVSNSPDADGDIHRVMDIAELESGLLRLQSP